MRQLRDMKGAFDFSTFKADDLSEYAVSCGHALAHAMAKAGDPALICGYFGKSDGSTRLSSNSRSPMPSRTRLTGRR
ncbi:DUF2252 family protein [Paraburkholderia sp. 40]|uniref:DUF2252 family protein n=1 Tax=Paraburkholderia sp. 40 TaxID=2991059 RepID=UPI003D25ED3C